MDYGKYIDHSLLHPTHTINDLQKLCEEAMFYKTATVCVKPDAVIQAKKILQETDVLIATVIGFPHGSNTTETKVFETQNSILNGAQEIDMVVNIGKVKEQNWEYVKKDIQEVFNTCQQSNSILKVIFETTFITKNDIIQLCKICSTINVDFIKTSTGFDFTKTESGNFQTVGATIENIKLMREHASKSIKIKASGGIRTSTDFLALINAGADRIGTSATKDILESLNRK